MFRAALLILCLLVGQGARAALSDPIYLDVYSAAPAGTTFVTPSVSVTNGDLVIILTASVDGSYLTSLTQGFSAGSWTIGDNASTTYGSNNIAVSWAYAQVTATGSGTITGTINAYAGSRFQAHVYRIPAGFDTTTPIAQQKIHSTTTLADMNANDNVTGTFDSAPSVNSALISFCAGNAVNNDWAPLSGWTLGLSQGGGGIPTASMVDSASTSTTFGGQVLYVDQNPVAVVLGIEIQEAAGGGPAIPIFQHHQLQRMQ